MTDKNITGYAAIAIVREFFPDYSREQAWDTLLTFTGWPGFWKSDDVAACIREQLQELKAIIDSGRDPYQVQMDYMDAAMTEANAMRDAEEAYDD